MSGVLDASLVTVALVGSATYALLSLGPKAWRRRCSAGLATLADRASAGSVRQRLLLKLAGRTNRGGCSACDNCGSEAAPAAKATASAPGLNGEVRVPLERIGRRP